MATAQFYDKGKVDELLGAKANCASPAFTGTPTAPTPTASDNSTKVATTAFVKTAVAEIAGRGYLMRDENGVYAVFPD